MATCQTATESTSKEKAAVSDRLGEDLVCCSICLDVFRHPKVLPCVHTFCQSCISRHYEIYKLRHGGRLSCPACRELMPVPRNGIAGLRDDVCVQRIHTILQPIWCILNGFGGEPRFKSAVGMTSGMEYRKGVLVSTEDEKKRATMIEVLDSTQHQLSQIRTKLLHMYLIENHVRYEMNSECSALHNNNLARKKKKLSDKELRSRKQEIEDSHTPSLCQLATQQDRLYQVLAEVKTIHDILELILERSPAQVFQAVYPILVKALKESQPFLKGKKHKRRMDACSDVTGGATFDPEGDDSGIEADDLDLSLWKTSLLLEESANSAVESYRSARDCSEFKVRLLFKIGTRGSGDGQFDHPGHAAFLPDGAFVVCDRNNQRLQIFEADGTFRKHFLQNKVKPRRVCYHLRDGMFYISDELSETVKVFTATGHYVRSIGESFFQCPAGMAINSAGNILMTDSEGRFASLHSNDGKSILIKFYLRFLTDPTIPNPYYACTNDDDQIIVSDDRNNIVKVFSNTGQFLFHISGLKCPRGVCTDPEGNILVVEGEAHRVSMYSSYGKFITHLIGREHGLCFPIAVEMNDTGHVIVTQCGYYSPHEVLMFKMY